MKLQNLFRALKARKTIKMITARLFGRAVSGVVIWEGVSPQDNAPIVAIATGFNKPSRNSKTGDMIQIWIIRTDTPPHKAVDNGHDLSVCGYCPHRRGQGGDCYVLPFQAPLRVYREYKANKYPRATSADISSLFTGLAVRFGAYGDPAFIPVHIIKAIESVASVSIGYTHQATNPKVSLASKDYLKSVFMASADSARHAARLQAQGWKTFRVSYDPEEEPKDSLCKAEAEGLNCLLCQGCDATDNIYIPAHGQRARVKA